MKIAYAITFEGISSMHESMTLQVRRLCSIEGKPFGSGSVRQFTIWAVGGVANGKGRTKTLNVREQSKKWPKSKWELTIPTPASKSAVKKNPLYLLFIFDCFFFTPCLIFCFYFSADFVDFELLFGAFFLTAFAVSRRGTSTSMATFVTGSSTTSNNVFFFSSCSILPCRHPLRSSLVLLPPFLCSPFSCRRCGAGSTTSSK